jgi:hypothetical protein
MLPRALITKYRSYAQIKHQNLCLKLSDLCLERKILGYSVPQHMIIFRMAELRKPFKIYVEWLDVC